MLYEEDYHPEPVQTHGTEDTTSLVSSLPLSFLEHEFYPCWPLLVPAFTKVVSCPLFSEHKGPPSTKQNAVTSTGEEGSNPDGNLYTPACLWWGGHSLGCWVPDADIAVITGVTHQLLSGACGVTPKVLGLAPHQITTDFLHPLALPAKCLSASDEDLTSGTEAESSSSKSSGSEPDEISFPPSDFQDMSQNPMLHVTYKDLVPMTRLFQLWLPISRVD